MRVFALLMSVVLAGVCFGGDQKLASTEPTYRSKTLSEWIALLREKGNDTEVLTSATDAVVEIAGRMKPDVPTFTNLLKDKDEGLQYAAELALGNMGAVAVPALSELLSHKDVSVRRHAANALGRIRWRAKAAIPALTELLKKKDEARQAAAEALGSIGREARPAVAPLTDVAVHSVLEWQPTGRCGRTGTRGEEERVARSDKLAESGGHRPNRDVLAASGRVILGLLRILSAVAIR